MMICIYDYIFKEKYVKCMILMYEIVCYRGQIVTHHEFAYQNTFFFKTSMLNNKSYGSFKNIIKNIWVSI